MRGSEVAPHQGESVLLQVEDLQTQFPTARGIVKAVDGVSFTLNRGEIENLINRSL